MPLEGVVEEVAGEADFLEQAVRDGEAIGRDVRQPRARFSSIGKSPRAAEKSMTVLEIELIVRDLASRGKRTGRRAEKKDKCTESVVRERAP